MRPSRMSSRLWIGTLVWWLVQDSLLLKCSFRYAPGYHVTNRVLSGLPVAMHAHPVSVLIPRVGKLVKPGVKSVANPANFNDASSV